VNNNQNPYWKATDPNGNVQRYDTGGNPITPGEAHGGDPVMPQPENPLTDPLTGMGEEGE
jgi:hypothetical protein